MRVPALYLITDPAAADVVGVVEAALAAAPAGLLAVQARVPGGPARELLALARALLPPCRAAGAPLLINDRADVAQVLGADGVQLPERGLSVREARALLGPHAWIGASRHDRAGLHRAAEQGADFATLGPVGQVPGKSPPLGVEGFGRIASDAPLPVLALGGVGSSQLEALREAGASGVAVIRAVFDSPDPAAAVRALLPSER